MGLCKCPKRKVTNLFCFEHKVNVCENCLVEDHVRCVIKSYLQWLQDSDFDTACCICQDTLEAGEVVRLLCYDVLHVSCAEKFLLAYPPHTAPDGFFCPACHGPFLPPEVAVSPVADQLRLSLDGMKDLQKRLHGLSAAIPEQSKSSPPTDRRPEPEGKEGKADPTIDLPQSDYVNIYDRVEQVANPPSIVDEVPSEKDLVSKDASDDPESETLSSASDFIATHPGSHSRGGESEAGSVSPPSHQRDLLSSIEVPAPIPTDFAASGSTVAGATEDLPSSKGAAPSFASSFLEANGIAPNFTKTVAVDMAGGNFSLPFGASPSKSIAVPIEEPLSAPLAGIAASYMGGEDASESYMGGVGASSSFTGASSSFNGASSSFNGASSSFIGGRETNVDMSWTLAGSTAVATSSVTTAARTKTESGVSSALQRQASFTNSGSGYSDSTPTQLPFSETEQQSGANARSSSSYIPRVPQSFPSNVPRDDHDDHKYRRKPIMEVVRTWLKIFSPPRGRRSSPSLWRRFVIITLIAVISLVCLVLLFHHLGRSGRDDDDPLLDLKANPFVKVDDS